ncbi:MAG: hypothetical protein CMI60_06135 [Parvibaculum sp.]|nr:hypothetical protein [Parvibaculum sp.]
MKELTKLIEDSPARSAWQRGVKSYAVDLLDDVEDRPLTKETLLNGADDWSAYSYGGSALIYDAHIAETLCTPSELKKTRNGERNPNASETWLDCQGRALHQACSLVLRLARRLERIRA